MSSTHLNRYTVDPGVFTIFIVFQPVSILYDLLVFAVQNNTMFLSSTLSYVSAATVETHVTDISRYA